MTLFLLSLGHRLKTSTFKLTSIQIISHQKHLNAKANFAPIIQLILANRYLQISENIILHLLVTSRYEEIS